MNVAISPRPEPKAPAQMSHRHLLAAYREAYNEHRRARGSKGRLAAAMKASALQAELIARMGPEPGANA